MEVAAVADAEKSARSFSSFSDQQQIQLATEQRSQGKITFFKQHRIQAIWCSRDEPVLIRMTAKFHFLRLRYYIHRSALSIFLQSASWYTC